MLLSPAEFLQAMPDTAILVPFDPAVVRSLRLSQNAEDYLVEVGLPISDNFRFGMPVIHVDLPHVRDVCLAQFDPPSEALTMRVLGSNTASNQTYQRMICLCQQTGKVFHLGGSIHRPKLRLRLMNSGVAQLDHFYLCFARYDDLLSKRRRLIESGVKLPALEEQADPEWLASIEKLVEETCELDPEVGTAVLTYSYNPNDNKHLLDEYYWVEELAHLLWGGYL